MKDTTKADIRLRYTFAEGEHKKKGKIVAHKGEDRIDHQKWMLV